MYAHIMASLYNAKCLQENTSPVNHQLEKFSLLLTNTSITLIPSRQVLHSPHVFRVYKTAQKNKPVPNTITVDAVRAHMVLVSQK